MKKVNFDDFAENYDDILKGQTQFFQKMTNILLDIRLRLLTIILTLNQIQFLNLIVVLVEICNF